MPTNLRGFRETFRRAPQAPWIRAADEYLCEQKGRDESFRASPSGEARLALSSARSVAFILAWALGPSNFA